MKRGEDFCREFPEVEPDFEAAAEKALQGLKKEGGHTYMVKRLAAAIAMLLFLAAATAVAAGVIRRDAAGFISGHDFTNLNSSAEETLAKSVVDMPIDLPNNTRLTLRQAVYDGMAVYLLFEAKPAKTGWMIATQGIFDLDTDQAGTHGSGYPSDVNIYEYAAQQGYAGVQLMEIYSEEMGTTTFDSWMNEDGSCSLMVWSFVRPEYRALDSITLHLRIVEDATRRHYSGDELRVNYPVTIPLVGEMQTLTFHDVIPLPDEGITVRRFDVIQTPMTTYLLLDYEVTDGTLYSRQRIMNGVIRLGGANGNRLPKGTQPLSLVVDRELQRMGTGSYYITTRELPAGADVLTLVYNDEVLHTYRLK